MYSHYYMASTVYYIMCPTSVVLTSNYIFHYNMRTDFHSTLFSQILRINEHLRKRKRENLYAYGTSLQLQAAFHEIKITKIFRCGVFAKYTFRENLYTYGILLVPTINLSCAHKTHAYHNKNDDCTLSLRCYRPL